MSVSIYKVGVEHVAYYMGCKGHGGHSAGAAGGRHQPAGASPVGGAEGIPSGGSPAGGSAAVVGASGGGGAPGGGAPLVGYYTGRDGELAGRWAAGGSMGVAVGAPVTPQQLTASLSAVDPETGERLGRRYTPGGTYVDNLGVTRRRRKFSAYDMVYAPPKSVSAAWALADPATRKEVEAAWDRSVGAVVGFVQTEAVASRSGTNGVRREEVPAGATIARFDHWTSRAADPHVHAHLLVHNRVQCEDGKWRTLDGRLLYHNSAAASAVGGAVLRAELSRRLGWSWDRVGDSWHAELAGSPRRLIAQWSTRRRQIDRAAQAKIRRFETDQQREPTPAERAELWARAQRSTRPSKQDDPDPHTRWHREAEALGVDPAVLTASYQTARRREPDGYDRAELVLSRGGQAAPAAVADAVVAQLEQLGQASSGLSRPDILRTLWATLNAGAALDGQDIDVEAELGRLATELWERATSRLVERDGRWYSTGLASAEVAAVSWLASDAQPAAAAADTAGLGGDQAAAVDTILNSATQGVLVLGPAGAGKTEMLSRVAAAVGADRVLAVAPTAEAAANLGAALDVGGETAARAALSDDQVPQGGWVIVDEAGQLDTRTLAALAGRAAAADARMILVGDTAQQGSVGAGGVFAALADRPDLVPGAVLSELWRFCDRDEARATVGLRRGNVDALAYHTERGRVHDSTEAELPAVAADWWAARRHQDTIITAPTRRLVADINSAIAAHRHRAGETGPAVRGEGDNTIRVGDTVTTRRNNRRIVASDGGWIRNGDRWVITGTTPDGQITARRLDHSATVTLPNRYTDEHLQLGYATTQTRVQSLTVDAALCAVTHTSRRDQLYVGMTRGRAENHLLVVTDQPQHDEDTPPDHLPPDHIIHTVMSRGGSHPLSVPAGSFTVTPQVAAAHLHKISNTPHNQPLPDLPAADPRRILTHGITAQTGGVEAEALIGGAIGAWLEAELAADAEADEAARAWEDAMFDHIENGGDIADLIPARTDPHRWIPDDDAGYDSLPPPDPDDDDPDTVTATPDQYPPALDPAQVEAVIERVIDRWGADHFEPYLTLADGWANTPPPDPRNDPGPLVALAGLYQQARHAGDDHLAGRAGALMAAVADPTLRDTLTPHTSHRLADADRRWAKAVRAHLRAWRADRWAPVLDALDQARSQLRAHIPQSGTVTAHAAADHDRTHWHQAVAEWIDDGAAAPRLAAVWHTTNRRTAQTLAGIRPPTAPARNAEAPWRNVPTPDGPPPTRLPARLPPIAPSSQPAAAHRADDGHDHLRRVLRRSADYYHQQLLTVPAAEPARRYLTQRGIEPADWAKWKLGWAPDQWRGLCNHLRDDQAAVDAGVANTRRGRTYDVLRGRVVFPIRDTSGDVIALAGRTLPGTDAGQPKYLNTRTTALYHKSDTLYGIHEAADGIRSTATAGIVEGYTDAIAAHSAGLTNVVATGGTAFTQSHLQRIIDAGAHHLTAGFDGDDPGQTSQQKLTDQAHQAGIPTTSVTFPTGTDPASLEPDALLDHWHTGLPQPWAHIQQHLDGGDINTRARGHRHIAAAYHNTDPTLANLAAHQALTHTYGATPHTLTAWHRPLTTTVPHRRSGHGLSL